MNSAHKNPLRWYYQITSLINSYSIVKLISVKPQCCITIFTIELYVLISLSLDIKLNYFYNFSRNYIFF